MAKAYLEPNEVESLEKAATCMRDRLLIRLLSRLGCRISEALAIALEDIDLARGTVTIQHLKTRLKLLCPSCDAKVEEAVAQAREHRKLRTLHLDKDTLERLRGYINRGGPVSRSGKQLIFGINRHHAWHIVTECARRAGLSPLVNSESGRERKVSPHRLRDAFAVMAVQQDDSTDGVRMLQEWLGHANIGTTMRYRKVAGQELKEWYQKLWSDKGKSSG